MKADIWTCIYYTVIWFGIAINNTVYVIILPLTNIPFIKRLYEKRGIAEPKKYLKAIKDYLNNPFYYNLQRQNKLILGLSICLGVGGVNIISCFTNSFILFGYGMLVPILIIALAGAFNYVALWRNDKYKEKLSLIIKSSKKERIQVLIIGHVAIFMIIAFLIFSFYLVKTYDVPGS